MGCGGLDWMDFHVFVILNIQGLYKFNLLFLSKRLPDDICKYRAWNLTDFLFNSCSETSEIKSEIKMRCFIVLRLKCVRT